MVRFLSKIGLAAVLAALFVTSCQSEQQPQAQVTLTASESFLQFAGNGDIKTLDITASGTWKASADESWITLSPMSGVGTKTVTVSAAPNPAASRREGSIKFALTEFPDRALNVMIFQAEAGASAPDDPQKPDDPDDPGEPEEPGQVIPRSDFILDTDWGVTGSIMNLNWGLEDALDIPMLGEPSGWVAAFDVVVKDGEEFKFRQDNSWDTTNYGAGAGQPKIDRKYQVAEGGMDNNFKLPAGTYDLYLQPTYMLLYVEEAGAEFAHGDAKADAGESENVRIYLLNNSTWDKPFMYAYVGSGELQPYGNWPGTYASGTKQFGDYTWTYWEASGFNGVGNVNLILNNNGVDQYPADGEKEELWSGLTILTNLFFVWDGTAVTQVEDPNAPGVTGKGITPAEMKFGSSSWTVIGDIEDSMWGYDYPMDTEGYWEVARGISLTQGAEFKFRQDRKWESFDGGNDKNLGIADGESARLDQAFSLAAGAGNISAPASGKFDIYLCVEKKIAYILTEGAAWTHELEGKPEVDLGGDYNPNLSTDQKLGGITYQVNIFSFKDSNNDGYGDLNGITQSLDYFDKLGVTALWLSPLQPAQSYHGYDVTDYEAVNKRFGTEEDFQNLINKAHEHNIRIYMDYVINHSGDQNKWFLDCKKKGPESEYWDYYSLSKDPQADVAAGKVPQAIGFDKGKWFPVLIGADKAERLKIELDWTNASAPTIKVSKTSEPVTSASASYKNSPRYLLWGSATNTQFADGATSTTYQLVLDFESSWGCLVRTNNGDNWPAGSKWGFNKTGDQLQYGVVHPLYNSTNNDDIMNIVMPGGEIYYYYTEFGTGMFVDFNYGQADKCADSKAFKAIIHSAQKWLEMGVDGFRLDAVKHIYCNETGPENKAFWRAFYDACNTIYKQNASKRSGLKGIKDDNIFMVGEVLSGDGDCTPFYNCLPALFEFQFWWDVRECLNNESIFRAGYGQNFSSSLPYRWYNHKEQRSDAISTPKLANHDEDRTASTLGNYKPKIRLAAAILLTAAGRPYIYQGEELGYWGTKAGGDEYVRTPILWTTSQSSAASKGVSNKVDWNMLQPSISVEAQSADETSLLTLYRHFAYARNVNPALANGYPEADERTMGGYDGHIAGWYLHQVDGEKVVLVLHNFSSYQTDVTRWPGENATQESILVSNGKVKVTGDVSTGTTVTLPAYSSVVFALN